MENLEKKAPKRKIKLDYPWITAAIALVALVVILSIVSPVFLTSSNIMGILRQASVYVIMGLGMSFVLMISSISIRSS